MVRARPTASLHFDKGTPGKKDKRKGTKQGDAGELTLPDGVHYKLDGPDGSVILDLEWYLEDKDADPSAAWVSAPTKNPEIMRARKPVFWWIVNDREVSDAELTDACAARRDGRDDAARPIANVAYVFVDRAAAEARLDALWLRELECRSVADGTEVRLDTEHHRDPAPPAWVGAKEPAT